MDVCGGGEWWWCYAARGVGGDFGVRQHQNSKGEKTKSQANVH
jgi:hypothetical protein